jgi:hypothetical protein
MDINIPLADFQKTSIERDADGLYWLYDRYKNIICEVFFKSEGQSFEEMLDAGYIPLPFLFEGEEVFVNG